MLVGVSGLTKTYGSSVILEDVTFIVNEGDRIAIIGENGSGKSTLFKVIAERLPCDRGQVVVSKGVEIGYLPQETHAPDNITLSDYAAQARPDLVTIQQKMRELETLMADPSLYDDAARADKILSGYSELQERFESEGGYTVEAKVKEVLSGLGFPPEQLAQPVSTMSGGEKKLASLARLLIQQPDLILLDEPDNHLDVEAKQWLQGYIEGHKGGVVIISHDRYFLDQFINHILELEDRHIYDYAGNYTESREEKLRRLERNEVLYNLRQRELKQLEKSARQLQEWSALSKKFAGRARNRKRMLEVQRRELEETPIPIIDRKTIDVKFDAHRSGKSVLEMKEVSLAVGERTLFEPFNLSITYGERVGLVGQNGTGKTTLFKTILGQIQPTTGTVKLGSNVMVGYYSQEQETLDAEMTPVKFIRNCKPMYEEQAVALLRGKLLFSYNECFTKIGHLSGGEKSRLQIMGLALQGANFLLLDEPTNNLDIPSMEVLEDALEEFQGTIFAISHDRYFLDRIADRIVAIENDVVSVFEGNFTDYYEKTGKTNLPTRK